MIRRRFLMCVLASCLAVGCGGSQNADNGQPPKDGSAGQAKQKDGTTYQPSDSASNGDAPQPANDSRDEDVKLAKLAPHDAVLVVSLRPRQILTDPAFADIPIQKMLEMLSYDGFRNLQGLGHFAFWPRTLGKELTDVEQAAYILASWGTEDELPPKSDVDAPTKSAADEPDEAHAIRSVGSYEAAFVVRFSQPVDRGALHGLVIHGKKFRHEGTAFVGAAEDSPSSMAAFLADPRTVVVGTHSFVKQLISLSLADSAPEHLFAEALDSQSDFAAAGNFLSIRPLLSRESDPFSKMLATVDWATIEVNVRPTVSAILNIKSPTGAGQLREMIDSAVADAEGQFAAIDVDSLPPDFPYSPQTAKQAIKTLDGMLDGLKTSLDGDKLTVGLLNVANAPDLAELLAPLEAVFDESPLHDQWSAATKPAENETAEIIRRLIPTAAGMPAETFVEFASGTAAPSMSDLTGHGVSTSIMILRIVLPKEAMEVLYPKMVEELQFTSDTPHPDAFAAALLRTMPLGYASMIARQDITGVTCNVDGNSASGEVTFEVPDVYGGKFSYVARRTGDSWRITEFRLPARSWRFVLDDDGTWKATDRWGRLDDRDRFPKSQAVTGTVTVNERPVNDARVSFYHEADPTLVLLRGRTDEKGEYAIDLPVGKYYVAIRVEGLEGKHEEPHKSGLVVEVADGPNALDFNLKK